ncbi:hypothetical protein TSAR_000125 [Trichomalopsis sarcophagae]|uniref:Uncharacterized protein n=1 Tax=Trichomalopsis sarcophagae TaxID=543379 RepID=A0A232F656_9HYME|nr:hypothetical protein TSAR_000125 [Trichomalopsis sarcophagae]
MDLLLCPLFGEPKDFGDLLLTKEDEFLLDQRTSRQMLISSISVNEQRDTSVSIDEKQSPVNRKQIKRKNDQPLKETVGYENNDIYDPPEPSEYSVQAQNVHNDAYKENEKIDNLAHPDNAALHKYSQNHESPTDDCFDYSRQFQVDRSYSKMSVKSLVLHQLEEKCSLLKSRMERTSRLTQQHRDTYAELYEEREELKHALDIMRSSPSIGPVNHYIPKLGDEILSAATPFSPIPSLLASSITPSTSCCYRSYRKSDQAQYRCLVCRHPSLGSSGSTDVCFSATRPRFGYSTGSRVTLYFLSLSLSLSCTYPACPMFMLRGRFLSPRLSSRRRVSCSVCVYISAAYVLIAEISSSSYQLGYVLERCPVKETDSQ